MVLAYRDWILCCFPYVFRAPLQKGQVDFVDATLAVAKGVQSQKKVTYIGYIDAFGAGSFMVATKSKT